MRQFVIRTLAVLASMVGSTLLLISAATSASAGSVLTIVNTVTSGPTFVQIPLNVDGATGSGAISFTVTGSSGCIVTHTTIRSTLAGTCVVTAHQAASKTGSAGTSAPVSFTFDHAPGALRVPIVAAGDHRVSVSWTAPNLYGGSPITGYSVVATPTVTPPSGCTDTLSTSCVFTGLTEGTKYTFTVTATNAAGSSTSKSGRSVMPFAVVDGHNMLPGGNYNKVVFASGSNLSGLNLTGAKFSSASLIDANLTGATLTNVNLDHATLTGATVAGANFAGAKFLQNTTGTLAGSPAAMPSGWSVTVGYLVGPTANLANATLTGANLDGVDLSKATMSNIVSAHVNGVPIKLPTGWTLANGTLFGPGAVVTGADLTGADLSTAAMRGIVSGDLTGTPSALPLNWTVANGYLVGPSANLTNANLSGANLTGISISRAVIAGADFSGATLTGLRSGFEVGSPSALPSQWSLISGYLIGPGANLSSATLTAVTFDGSTGLSLAGVDFTDANLTNDIFSTCDITGAVFSTANFTGVSSSGLTGTPASLPDSSWSISDGVFTQVA